MTTLPRRDFLRALAIGGMMPATFRLGAAEREAAPVTELHVGTFRFDVTPPPGHALCGGWIKPVEAVDDSLEAIGYVILGAGQPLVFCAVDWTGLLNESHVRWRVALAEAAGTTPDRVMVHCVHQHNAPLVCHEAARWVEQHPDLPRVFEPDFFDRCLDAGRKAVQRAVRTAQRVTHLAHGTARVAQVASNRRVSRHDDGRVRTMRGSASKDPALVALPEGLIDPVLRTTAFFAGDRKILACHYYATHPMSYYGDGRVSADFCGLARRKRQQQEPDCTHVYFTGCAGNIAAGKYNDGSPAARVRLTDRMLEAMIAADAGLRPEPIGAVQWTSQEIVPSANPALGKGALAELMTKRRDAVSLRMRPAFKLAFINRCERRVPLVLGALKVNDIASLFLPSEPFVEYQLRAQAIAGGRPVAVAAYGDNGPWYIPVQEEFPAGGYEVDFAFGAPETDDLLTSAMRRLLV